MHFRSLRLSDFRNFTQLQVELRPRLNFFVGQNGQGKTNFLEAVYLLSHGVSFRPVQSQSLILNTQGARARIAKITAHAVRSEFEYSTEMLIESGRRSAVVNGKRVSAATLQRTFPTVLFSPESLAAIKSGPEQRRLLADEIAISQHGKHAKLLSEQLRCLRARNRLLKNLSEGLGPRSENELALESLNKIYFLLSAHLTSARIEALKSIQDDLQGALHSILDGSRPLNPKNQPEASTDLQNFKSVAIEYLISDQPAISWSETQVFDALRNRHRELASQEIAGGLSLVGPHKHDIKFLVNGNDSRFYCSQGQQRALILSLKIAQIVYHHRVHQTYPVLLLDDVLSELDMKKRANLMKFLEGISAQILITATDLTWSDQFSFDRNSIFSVIGGRVEPQPISIA